MTIETPASPSADLLSRAAQRMEELISGATPGPWGATDKSGRYGGIVGPAGPNTDPGEAEGYGGELVAESLRSPNADLIVTLQRSAVPLVFVLRYAARRPMPATFEPWISGLAREILGETEATS